MLTPTSAATSRVRRPSKPRSAISLKAACTRAWRRSSLLMGVGPIKHLIDDPPSGANRWTGPAVVVVASLAALLYARNIAVSEFVPYYSAVARSMSESWSSFLFGSFDPAGSITLDKIPGFLWPQALSARTFGFHPWALTLPQVIEGVIAVVFLYRAVRRWAGAGAGVLAAAIFTFTPVVASMFGHVMEDGALTMCSVLAASAWQRAVG